MAITLTQDWQVVASHRWQPGTGFDFSMYLEARYTEQNTSTNSTKILTRLRSVVNKGQGSGYRYGFNCSYCTSISGTGQWFFGTETILESSEQTIYHENDGSKSLTLYASGYVSGVSYSFDINGVINFPKINRLPVITSLTSQITDEDNIVVKFDNPGGFYIKAYFYRLSGYDFSRENITSPYTFKLTDDERNAVRQFMKNMTVDKNASFTIEAYSSSDFSESSYIGEASATMQVTIKDANPTISLTVTETNQKVIDLYGTNNASTVVKNLSQLKLASTVGLKKYATLKSRTYTYNSNQTSSATTVTIVPTVNKVSVKAVDSRNLSASASKTLNMVDYLPMVINSYDFFRTSPTSSEIKLSADLTYFQGTYNGTVNAPVIQYKMGANGTLRTLTADDYTLDTTNKKITITNLVLTDTLVYTKAETFYLYVSDIFTSDSENDVVLKGVPTFEAGETDFQVNGKMYIANESGENEKELNVSGKASKNLFNKNNYSVYDGYINGTSLAFVSNTNGKTIYLKVQPSTTYTISREILTSYFAIGTGSKVPITGDIVSSYISYSSSNKATITTGQNDNYIYIYLLWATGTDVTLNEIVESLQVEKYPTNTEYEEYYEPTIYVKDSNGYFHDLPYAIGKVSKNIFNSNVVSGGYNKSSGEITVNADNLRNETPIKVEPNKEYIFSNNGVGIGMNVLEYDSNMSFIKFALIDKDSSFTTTDATKYINCFRSTSAFDKPQLEKGSIITSYEKYYEPTLLIKNSNDVFQEVDINKNNYSIPEQKIGTWINGKPIYRKVIKDTMPSATTNGTNVTKAISIVSNIEEVINQNCYFLTTSSAGQNMYVSIPYINSSGHRVTANTLGNSMNISNGITSYNEKELTIIVEYTKTTD